MIFIIKRESKKKIFDAKDFLNGNGKFYNQNSIVTANENEQSCCSYLYSKVFMKNCFCVWMDNREIFRASHKKCKFNLNFI